VHPDAALVEGDGTRANAMQVQLFETAVDDQFGCFCPVSFAPVVFLADGDSKDGVVVLVVDVGLLTGGTSLKAFSRSPIWRKISHLWQ
jgi:hypothetical protein